MHIGKVKLTSLGGLLAHDLRFDGDGIDHAKEGRGQGEKIDPARTCLNRLVEKSPDGDGWTMRKPTLSDRRRAVRRLREAERTHQETRGRRIGKNTVTASLVATRPADWPGTDDEFVGVTASYFDSLPGETLAMVVHYDETTPHVHCVKLLTTDDGCIQGFGAVYDRRVYQRFHPDMVAFSRAQGFEASWLLDENDEVGKALSGLDQRRYGVVKDRLSEVESREDAVALVEEAQRQQQRRLDERERTLQEARSELARERSELARSRSEASRRMKWVETREAALDARETALRASEAALDEREGQLRKRESSLGLRATAASMPSAAADGKSMIVEPWA